MTFKASRVNFDGLIVDFSEATIERQGVVNRPAPELWALLARLIERAPDHIVRLNEFPEIFGHQSYDAYVQHVHRLRETLGDLGRHPTFIKNVRRHGYLWVAVHYKEEMIESGPQSNNQPKEPNPGSVLSPLPIPQKVRWGPLDGKPAGICIDTCHSGLFVPWTELKPEIETLLLPQVRNVPLGSTVRLGNLEDRVNWSVRILDPAGEEVGSIWFGVNADARWRWDGLVRLGDSYRPPKSDKVVWQVFERYSDGSYRCVEAIVTD